MKYKNLQEKGIVLKTSPIGENNEQIWLLTEENGLIQAFSFGTQKNFKKERLYSFLMGNFTLENKKNQWRIVDIDSYFFGEKIKENIKKFYLGNLFLEIILRSFSTQESFSLLEESLLLLENIKEDSLSFLSLQFISRWLSLQGEEGDLTSCHFCERNFSQIGFYGTIEQSFICEDCHSKKKNLKAFPLNEGIRRYLLFSEKNTMLDSLKAKVDTKSSFSLNLYLYQKIRSILKYELKTWKINQDFLFSKTERG